MSRLWMAGWLGAVLFLSSTAAEAEQPAVVTLDNGLTVLVEPVKDAEGVAVAVAIPFGRADDPAGQEGRAEVVLRAGALSKTGTAPERPPLSLQSVDRTGLKAFLRVGRTCSGFATRCTPEALPALLAETAARFTALEPSETLLAGIREQLQTLREGVTKSSNAASVFRARLDALPEPHGNRPYGTKEGVEAVTLDAVRATAKEVFATQGAVVAIVGAVETARVRPLVKKTLGAVPASNRRAPAAAGAFSAPPGTADPVRVPVTAGPAASRRDAAAALAAAAPADLVGLAAWLVLVARICEEGWPAPTARAPAPVGFTVEYFPGAEPDLVTLRRAVPDGEDDRAAIAPLTGAVTTARAGAVTPKDVLSVRKWLSPRLGLASMELAGTPLLLDRAFGMATLRVRGWDGQAALDAVKKVKRESLDALVEKAAVRSAIAVPQ